MVPYLRFHLGDRSFHGVRLLSPENLRLLQTPLVYVAHPEFEELGDQHYGSGFACCHYRGERTVADDGGWVGWCTRMDMLPDRKLGAVVLTNRTGSPLTSMLSHAVFDWICGKDPVPWFDRFLKRRREYLEHAGENRTARESARKQGTRPSHSLAEYAGAYEHPAYGRITIDAAEDALHWCHRGMEALLTHRHYDVFEVPETPHALGPDLLSISFGYDRDGTVDRLLAPFEPMVSDIVFQRLPTGEALDPVFRAACVGTYQVGVQTHVVALDAEGQLTLSPSDQPMYRLVPYQGRAFAIAELEGFKVEFQHSGASGAEAIVFHQPNGTFLARWVADAVPSADTVVAPTGPQQR